MTRTALPETRLHMRLRGWGTKQVWLARFEDAKWFYAQYFRLQYGRGEVQGSYSEGRASC